MLKSKNLNFSDISSMDGIHSIHSYPAAMIYPLCKTIILEYSKEGDVILDPFCGSGTTLVEANFNRRHSIGIDINPLATLITKVKMNPIPLNELNQAYKTIFDKYLLLNGENYNSIPDVKNINYWFKEYVITDLSRIKKAIFTTNLTSDLLNFFKICFSETVRQVSNNRPGFKLHRLPKDKLEKYCPSVSHTFYQIVMKNIYNGISELNRNYQKDYFMKIVNSPQELDDNSIDTIVTSPPYGDSRTTVAYGQFSRLSLDWLGYELTNIDNISLGGKPTNSLNHSLKSKTLTNTLTQIVEADNNDSVRAREVLSYYIDIFELFKEYKRIVRHNGYICFVVGNRTVKTIQIPTDVIFVELFESLGMEYIETAIRKISNKRMPCQNSPTNISGEKSPTMTKEYIIVMRNNKNYQKKKPNS